MKTKGYQGHITKTAKVLTNDPGRQMEILTIKAFVKVPIYLFPKWVYLKGPAGKATTKTVTVKAEMSRPLELEPAQFDLSGKVTYRVEEVQAGRVFLIHFTHVPGEAKTYSGVLRLKTNYPEKPEISIKIRGRFKG